MNFLLRRDKSHHENTFATVSDYYAAVRKGVREKADHNKIESQIAFYTVIFFTLLSPLFVTLGVGWILGKVIPAVLSVLAAAATAWLQLRIPQRLWAIYRRAQRELEREKAKFDFRLAEYAKEDEPEKLLAQKVSDIAFHVHEQWEGLVPEPDAITSSKTPSLTEATCEA
jgi:hypothetical protein